MTSKIGKFFLVDNLRKRILCEQGTRTVIAFTTKEAAQYWLDNNEHPENMFDIVQAESLKDVMEHYRP